MKFERIQWRFQSILPPFQRRMSPVRSGMGREFETCLDSVASSWTEPFLSHEGTHCDDCELAARATAVSSFKDW
jgi:hypothetical protein